LSPDIMPMTACAPITPTAVPAAFCIIPPIMLGGFAPAAAGAVAPG
jgi:hypothetical protein